MGTMSGSPCLHYDCSNRNSFGYCKTTVCINEHYQQEQCGLPSTTNKSKSVVIKPQTNADRIRDMSDEKLAEWIALRANCDDCPCDRAACYARCASAWLDWLKQEAT